MTSTSTQIVLYISFISCIILISYYYKNNTHNEPFNTEANLSLEAKKLENEFEKNDIKDIETKTKMINYFTEFQNILKKADTMDAPITINNNSSFVNIIASIYLFVYTCTMPVLAPAYPIIPPAIVSGSVYLFTTESGLEYEVRFARKKNNLLHCSIAFGVLNEEYEGEEYIVVNKGEVFRVMATIVKVVQKYITEHPNLRSFEYSGEPTDKELDERLTLGVLQSSCVIE